MTYAILDGGDVKAVKVQEKGPEGTQISVRRADGSFTRVPEERHSAYLEGIQRYEQLRATNPRKAAMAEEAANDDGVTPETQPQSPETPSPQAGERPDSTPNPEGETQPRQKRDTTETKRDRSESPAGMGQHETVAKPQGERGGMLT